MNMVTSVETDALVAVMDDDAEKITQIMSILSDTDLIYLEGQASRLARTACREIENRRGPDFHIAKDNWEPPFPRMRATKTQQDAAGRRAEKRKGK